MRLVQQRYPDRNIVTAGRRAKAAFEAEQAEQNLTGSTSTAAAAAGKVWGEGEGQKVNMKEPPRVEVSQPRFVEVRDGQGEVVGRMSPASTSFPSSMPPSLPHPSHFLLSFSLNSSRAAAEHLLVLLFPSNVQWPNLPCQEAQTKPSRVLLLLFLLRQRRRQQHAREGACLRLFRRDRVAHGCSFTSHCGRSRELEGGCKARGVGSAKGRTIEEGRASTSRKGTLAWSAHLYNFEILTPWRASGKAVVLRSESGPEVDSSRTPADGCGVWRASLSLPTTISPLRSIIQGSIEQGMCSIRAHLLPVSKLIQSVGPPA